MSSPTDEFRKLVHLYIDLYGEPGTDDYSTDAQLGRLRLFRLTNGLARAMYLQLDAVHWETVWVEETGFQTKAWYQHLVVLRNKLILERLADV